MAIKCTTVKHRLGLLSQYDPGDYQKSKCQPVSIALSAILGDYRKIADKVKKNMISMKEYEALTIELEKELRKVRKYYVHS